MIQNRYDGICNKCGINVPAWTGIIEKIPGGWQTEHIDCTTLYRKPMLSEDTKGHVWGMWNNVERRFVFGIMEKSKEKAWEKFWEVAGKTAYKWRFDTKIISKDWVNPKNTNSFSR